MAPDTPGTGQRSDRRPGITAAARPATPSGQFLAIKRICTGDCRTSAVRLERVVRVLRALDTNAAAEFPIVGGPRLRSRLRVNMRTSA